MNLDNKLSILSILTSLFLIFLVLSEYFWQIAWPWYVYFGLTVGVFLQFVFSMKKVWKEE
ncbi:MAG: hypothetical protein Q8R34_02280 [bacterium]|nr:hypothetical protein [bacterium]